MPVPLQSSVIGASSGGAQANNCAIPAVAGQYSYCGGFAVTGGGATAGSFINITIVGVQGGPVFTFAVPTGATVAATPLIVTFNPPLQSTGLNTAITLGVPTFGAGNTNASAMIWGFNSI